MDKQERKKAWEAVAEAYAQSRDPDGPDTVLIEELRQLLPDEPTVIDIGSGDGARTLANLPTESIGVDISRRGLELASEGVPDARLIQGDMTALPIQSASADAITAYYAVFHVPRAEHSTVFSEFRRVLKPGGKLLMTLPTGRFETIREGWMGGRMFFSAPGRDKTLGQLREAGFEIDTTKMAADPLGSSTEFVFATYHPA